MKPIGVRTGSPQLHPIADDEVSEASGRRVVLRKGLGVRTSDLRLCEAANRILQGLEHPNIGPANRVERDELGRLVLCYPPDDATPLSHRLSASPTLTVHVLMQICAALDAAHGLGVIHGALTPGAIRLGEDSEKPTVTVADFGLGHLFGSKSLLEDRASWLPYSPEKQLGLEPTPAEDVYLLGAIGYAMLMGRPLFEAPTRRQTLRQHAIESPVDVVNGRLGCERWLAELLARCLRKEPDDRYPSPADVAAALRADATSTAGPRIPVPPKVGPPPSLRVARAPAPPSTLSVPRPKPAPTATVGTTQALSEDDVDSVEPIPLSVVPPPPPPAGSVSRDQTPPPVRPTDGEASDASGSTRTPDSDTADDVAANPSSEADASSETDAPSEDDASSETDAPSEDDASSETDAPSEDDASSETDAPSETDTPSETEERTAAAPVPSSAGPERLTSAEPHPPATANRSGPALPWVGVGIAAAALATWLAWPDSASAPTPPAKVTAAASPPRTSANVEASEPPPRPAAPPREPVAADPPPPIPEAGGPPPQPDSGTAEAPQPSHAAGLDDQEGSPEPPARPDAPADPSPLGQPTDPSALDPATDEAGVDDGASPDPQAEDGQSPEVEPLLDDGVDEQPPSVQAEPPNGDTTDGSTPRPDRLSAAQRKAEARRLTQEARTAARAGNDTKAIRLYQNALSVRSGHAVAAHELGAVYFNRGNYANAIRYAKRATGSAPRNGAYRLALGDYHYKSGNGAAARKHWQRAATLGNKTAKSRISGG